MTDITDWDMIMGYDFMVGNAIGALPHRATLVRENNECLTWLSTDYACGSSNELLRKRIGSSKWCKLWVPNPEETVEFSSRSMEWRRRCMLG